MAASAITRCRYVVTKTVTPLLNLLTQQLTYDPIASSGIPCARLIKPMAITPYLASGVATMAKQTRKTRKAAAPTYQSRADLLAMVNRLSKQVARFKEAQSDDDMSEPDTIDELPEVPSEGLPFRPTSRKSYTAGKATPEAILKNQLQNVLGDSITIHPTPYVRSLFAKPRRGLGGFQSLHAALQRRMGGTKTLDLSSKDFARVVNYSTNYGEGGFQQSLRWLVALWVAENVTGQPTTSNQSL